MKKSINGPIFFGGLAIAAFVLGLLHYFTAMGFWPLFAISSVAILVNAAIASTDLSAPDEQPDGPHGPGQ